MKRFIAILAFVLSTHAMAESSTTYIEDGVYDNATDYQCSAEIINTTSGSLIIQYVNSPKVRCSVSGAMDEMQPNEQGVYQSEVKLNNGEYYFYRLKSIAPGRFAMTFFRHKKTEWKESNSIIYKRR